MSQLAFSLTHISLQERFMRFHRAHPEVYAALVRLARQARSRRPDRRLGIKQLFEVVRWEMHVAPDERETFKLNNNMTSRYARLIAAQEPDLADAFELRELRAV